MEDISKLQKGYSIPDVELRESLKRDNKEYIIPKYNAFYDRLAFNLRELKLICITAVNINIYVG